MSSFKDVYSRVKETPEYIAAGVQLDVALMIESAMNQLDISRADLANAMGCSRAYITKSLSGDANFSILTLAKLSSALNCNLKIEMTSKVEKAKEASINVWLVRTRAEEARPLRASLLGSANLLSDRQRNLVSYVGNGNESFNIAA